MGFLKSWKCFKSN